MPEKINLEEIVKDSIALAKKEVGKAWKELKPYAEHEFRQFSENAEFLARLRKIKTISDEELASRMAIQKVALTNVLLAVKGIGIVSAQNVVNGVFALLEKALFGAIKVKV
jgi:hypothetical protein